MQNNLLNSHCNTPTIVVEDNRMFIQFYFYRDDKRLKKKIAGELNGSQFFKKDKKTGNKIEINKKLRDEFAKGLLAKTIDRLKIDCFNPYSLEFEKSDKASLPLLQWVDDYLKFKLKEIGQDGMKNINSTFKYFKEYIELYHGNSLTPKDIDVDLVKGFFEYKEENWNSNQTVNNNLGKIKTFVNWLVDAKDVLIKDPLKTLKSLLVEDSDKHKPYSNELGVKVLEDAKKISIELHILMQTIFFTLSRPAEILKLKKQDFDFNDGKINFIAKNMKTKKRKFSYIPDELIEIIKESIDLDSIPDNYYFLGNNGRNGSNGDYKLAVFGKYPNNTMRFNHKHITVRTHLRLGQEYTIYGWKHTGVVRLKEMGWANQKIREYTGHTSDKMLGIYAREYSPDVIKRTDSITDYKKEKQYTLIINESELEELKNVDSNIIRLLVQRIQS